MTEAETETELTLQCRAGDLPAWSAKPTGDGPWPGIVVLHDAVGMTTDLREQSRWLASAGYLTIAPDLYRGGGKVRCMFRMLRDVMAGRDDDVMAMIEAARTWLSEHHQCTGKLGVIGFCMGGGFALMLAGRGDYDAVSANYGGMNEDTAAALAKACPVVASYGGRDPTLRGEASKLRSLLQTHDIPHDVKEYPEAGHGFMNAHARGEMPWLFLVLGRLSRTRYNAEASEDSRRRIVAFFREHLGA